MKINLLTLSALLMMISSQAYAVTVIVGGGWTYPNGELVDNGDGTYTIDHNGSTTYTGVLVNGNLICQKEIRSDGAIEEYFYDENWRHTGWIITYEDGTTNKLEVYDSNWSSYINASFYPDGTLMGVSGLQDGYLGYDESQELYEFEGKDMTGEWNVELDQGYIGMIRYAYDRDGNLSRISGTYEYMETYQDCWPSWDDEGNEVGEECYDYEMPMMDWLECDVHNLTSCPSALVDQINNIEATMPELLERIGASRLFDDDFGKYGSTAYNNAASDDVGGNSGGDSGGSSGGDLGGGSGGDNGGSEVSSTGEPRQIHRIYTVKEATEALGTTGKNTFSLKYR